MSDDSQRPASSAEPMIPKSRLDELIADRNHQREENQFLRQQLSRAMPQQQRVEQEDPEMEELKQSNPGLYKKIKTDEQEKKRLRAGFATLADKQDKTEFLLETGAEGKKRLGQIEDIIARERANGNYKVTRVGIFNWMRGQERLAADERAAANPSNASPNAQGHHASASDDNAPSSDPSAATTVRAGTASPNFAEKSREERIKELENEEF